MTERPRHPRVTRGACEDSAVTGAGERVGFVRVLGPVQVVMSSGRVVDLPSASQRRLLSVLALHPRTSLRAEWLADVLGVSPGALRTSMSRLRRVLGDAEVETTTTGYRLDVDVDAEMFCRDVTDAAAASDTVGALERALSHWVGTALEEFAGEEWAAGEAVRLTELCASATEDLTAAMISESRWSEAVARLEGHIATYPLRDRPRGLLMEALAGDGRQADALRAFQEYRKLLAEEVGTEPSAQVREIEQRIATSWASGAADLPVHHALALHTRVIGRLWERRTLAQCASQARGSGLQTVVLRGEAGIGKTTVLAAFADQIHRGGENQVLYARCDEGAAVPLQPFRSMAGWGVEHVSTALLEAHVARCGGELQRVAPQLTARVAAPEPTVSDDATERFLVFEAVADLLRRIAGDGVLVVMLDDLHWAEPTALSLLRHLSRSLAVAPVLLIAS
jgi:DNA-binding SARP family transcriptional activator